MNPALIFLTAFTYPTRYAHPLHGKAMAEGLRAALGDRFLFVHGGGESGVPGAVVPFPHAHRLLRFLHLRAIAYALWCVSYSAKLAKEGKAPWVLLIDPKLACMLLLLKPFGRYRVVFETHQYYGPLIRAILYHLTDRAAFITRALAERIGREYPRIRDRSIVLPSAVDLARFDAVTETRAVLRAELGLPSDKKLIGYIGRFTPLGLDKGVGRLILALQHLPSDVALVLVGGTAEEIAAARAGSDEARIFFVPFVSPDAVPRYAKALDLLLYVPRGGSRFFELETSPMKLFEYMAAARPMLVSDLPLFREVLDEEVAFFADDGLAAPELAARIDAALRDGAGDAKAQAAYVRARQYAWPSRIDRLRAFLDL